MAVDDVTVVIAAAIADGSSTQRQPGAGVEEMMLEVGLLDLEGTLPDSVPAIIMTCEDGTNDDAKTLSGDSGNQAAIWFEAKNMGNNTNYFDILVQGGNTSDVSYSVIQVG